MATDIDFQHVLVHDIPFRQRVPGGAAAILKDGEVIAKHAWGFANLESRAPVTSNTVFPVCSISKQMICLVLTELVKEQGPEVTTKVFNAVRGMLPEPLHSNKDLTLQHMIDMQSGIRDYWALTVLWGATPQERFSIYSDVPEALKRLGAVHFAPGTQMSYSNVNFTIVGLAIEKVTGQTLVDLLRKYLFEPAEMKTAALRVDTARIPAPLVGYEGSEELGWIPYANRIEWAGDAGVQASLEDMIAYEKYVYRSSSDEESAYYKNAEEPTYDDGEPANYGNGFVHTRMHGNQVIGHTGGLPGFSLRRAYMPDQKMSLIALLNSETDTKPILEHVLRKIGSSTGSGVTTTISQQQTQTSTIASRPAEARTATIKWAGNYFDEEARIAVVVKQDKLGEVLIGYSRSNEKLLLLNPECAVSSEMRVEFGGENLQISRLTEHRDFTAQPLKHTGVGGRGGSEIDASMFEGEYHSEEIDSTFHVTGSGGMLYGAFDGYLGKGPAHTMRWLGENVWWLACFRSLDAAPPGYWTVAFRTSDDGNEVVGVSLSCWLARNVEYKKVGR